MSSIVMEPTLVSMSQKYFLSPSKLCFGGALSRVRQPSLELSMACSAMKASMAAMAASLVLSLLGAPLIVTTGVADSREKWEESVGAWPATRRGSRPR
jgi:hypothetical protein